MRDPGFGWSGLPDLVDDYRRQRYLLKTASRSFNSLSCSIVMAKFLWVIKEPLRRIPIQLYLGLFHQESLVRRNLTDRAGRKTLFLRG